MAAVHGLCMSVLLQAEHRTKHLSSHCEELLRQYAAAQEGLDAAREAGRRAQEGAAALEAQLGSTTQVGEDGYTDCRY